jgi:spore coat protein U-like protein
MMRRILVAAMVLGMLAMAGSAWAADTATVTVNAVVTGTCQFLTDGSVDFILDPSLGGEVTGTVTQPTFWCTKGASYTITDDNGEYESGTTYQMKHETLDEYIPYTFDYTASATGTGAGRSTTLSLVIASTVADADYANASSGNYSDTVTLTINP